DIGNLQNVDQKGALITHDFGSSQYSKSRWRGGFKRYHQRDYSRVQGYDTIQVTEIDLNAYTVKTNTRIQSENAGSVGNVSNIVVTNAGNSGFTDHDLA